MMPARWRWLLLVLLTVAAGARAVEDGDVLVLGRISDNPKRHHAQMEALLDYVVPKMATVGIVSGRILMARDAQQMASYLRRGRVDWVTETASNGLLLAEVSAARPLVATERDGVTSYHSVIFVRRDSAIRSLADLRGHSIAFQNVNSTSAFYAPAAALLAAGLNLELMLYPSERPRPQEVGYLFAQSEANIAAWVHKRVVDAGAFSDIDWQRLDRLPAGFRDDMQIIHRSDAFPRAVELVRGDWAPERVSRLREILLAAADDPAAREPLLRFFATNRFLPLEGEIAAGLERLDPAVHRVRERLR